MKGWQTIRPSAGLTAVTAWLAVCGPQWAPADPSAALLETGSDTTRWTSPACPSGAKSECIPQLIGFVVICTESKNPRGYVSVSDYCLGCHAESRPMTFEHPVGIEYPQREEFEPRSSLHTSLMLESGHLSCRTCHSGSDPDNHYLVEAHESKRVCRHCHLTAIACPSKTAKLESVCFPGRLNGGIRCLVGRNVALHAGASGFCSNCHGGMGGSSTYHSVDMEYPVGRPGFTPVEELDPGIKLEAGRVTCETCHEKRAEGIMLCVHCHPR